MFVICLPGIFTTVLHLQLVHFTPLVTLTCRTQTKHLPRLVSVVAFSQVLPPLHDMKKVVQRARSAFLERFLRQKKYIETKRSAFRVLWTRAKTPLSQTWQFRNIGLRSMGLLTLPPLRENQTWYAK